MAASPPVDVTSVPPSRTRMIVVLGLLVALGPLTIDMYLPALPRIAAELNLTSSVAQLTLTGTLAGLALGQLVIGPLSDSLGRRRPLVVGILLHMAASVLCMLAPNIEVLGVARGLQGLGAAAASVVAMAVVGDLFAESEAATVISRLMLVLGVAPVIAPSLGAAVLLRGSWHWVFAALVALAAALLVVAVLALPETLPVEHRRPLHLRDILGTYGEVLRDSRFVVLVLVGALGMSGLFAYIAGASFVLQGHYGLNQQTFALVFAAGAISLIGSTQFNVVLLRRYAPQTIAVWALVAATMFGAMFVMLTLTHFGGVVGFLVPVWAILAAMGLVIPNTPAVALARHPDAAGTAAAVLGAAQFGVGAAIAPVVGALGNSELALAVVMTVGVVIALVALLAVGKVGASGHERQDVTSQLVPVTPDP